MVIDGGIGRTRVRGQTFRLTGFAPSRDELSEHCTEQFPGFVSPETLAQAMTSLAAMLREDLILIDADPPRLFRVLALNAELVRSAT